MRHLESVASCKAALAMKGGRTKRTGVKGRKQSGEKKNTRGKKKKYRGERGGGRQKSLKKKKIKFNRGESLKSPGKLTESRQSSEAAAPLFPFPAGQGG